MSERKYQHRGYRAGERSEERREPRPAAGPRQPPPPPSARDAPRGRGLGAPSEAIFRCARCGEPAPLGRLGAFDARCERCGSDLHSCSNCAAFDPGARFECRKEIPARVTPKDRANRCDVFEPRTRREFAQEKARPADPRSAFDALFKP
jgi:hypothetical protein